MTTEWDEVGRAVPLTVLWFDDNQVVQVRTPSRDGYAALQIGAGAKRAHRANWARRNHCVAHGVPVKARLKEFRVSPDALLPPGTRLHAGHFKAGQYVAVQGTTLGKGFQGGMKRHGFKGQPASHGVSLTHRSIGSTGQRKSPGRTFKGKKMPGQMGCETRTGE